MGTGEYEKQGYMQYSASLQGLEMKGNRKQLYQLGNFRAQGMGVQ